MGAGPVRRLVRTAATPAALLAAAGAVDVASAQLVPDAPNQPGAVQSMGYNGFLVPDVPGQANAAPATTRGGFFGLVPDAQRGAGQPAAQPAAQPRTYAPPTGYAPQAGYAPQGQYAPPPTSRPAMTPQQVAVLRQQEAYRRQAMAAAQSVAPAAGPVVSQVDHQVADDEAEAAAPARVSVLGAVMQPRTYEFTHTAPNLGALLERAGGLTGKADRTVRIIRDGQQVNAVRYMPGVRLPLAAGDVVLCDPAPGTGPRERHTSYVAMVGLTDRPVVLKLKESDANVPAVLTSLNLPAESIRAVHVLPPARATGAGPGGPLPDGTVLIFSAGSVTPAQWRSFRDVAFGDLVKEAKPEATALADAFEPVRPRSQPTKPVVIAEPGPPSRVDAEPSFRIAPRLSARRASDANAQNNDSASDAEPDAVVTPSLSLPSRDAASSLPGPGPAPRATAAADPVLSLAAPSDDDGFVGDGELVGEGETVVDVTDLYDAGPNDVAMLPAPGESPFYGGGSMMTNSGSHLMPLENYAAPGLPAPTTPGRVDENTLRFAETPTAPGVYRDGVPASPRSTATPLPAPRPLSGEPAKPIPAEPIAPTPSVDAEADSADAAGAGFPWLPTGLGLGALLGAAAAAVAVRRKGAAASATAPTATPVPPAPQPSAAQSTAAPAPTAASPAPWSAALEDLIANRLPLEEEAIRLPDSVALHGRRSGMTKLRVQAAEGGPAAPRFADAGVRRDADARVDAAPRSQSFAA